MQKSRALKLKKKQVKRSLNSTVSPFLSEETDAELEEIINSIVLIGTMWIYYEFTIIYNTNHEELISKNKNLLQRIQTDMN